MDLLETFDPDAATSLQRVSGLSHEAFLELLALEGAAGCSTRQEYEALALRRLLVEAVAWQADALAAGFWSVVTPQELRRWVGRGWGAVGRCPSEGLGAAWAVTVAR